MRVYVRGKKLGLDPSQSIAKGGEADIFRLSPTEALKLFKQPDHPDLAGDPLAQMAAELRIAEHQTKLPEFPTNLPIQVVTPEALATNRSGRVLGYTMRFIEGAEVLLRYADKGFRQAGPSYDDVLAFFRDLHSAVEGAHRAGVIIGDFNDLNVLVKDKKTYLIDADSYQFGRYQCRVFTEKFLDPLLCDPHSAAIMLSQPYGPAADWYAFAVMAMQTLLFVGPYGGVYQPKDKSQRVAQSARPLHRITVFDSDVKYPKVALHYSVLPDDLLHYLIGVFKKDRREAFPVRLLDMEWKTCEACGLLHARGLCPACDKHAPAAVVQAVRVRGTVTCARVFRTTGLITYAAVQEDKLRYIYREGDRFKREGGNTVMRGPLDPLVRYRIRGDDTLVGRDNRLVVLDRDGNVKVRHTVDCVGSLPMFDSNSRDYFWASDGQLLRDAQRGAEVVGQALAGQTLFWAGEQAGFGFYRAGTLNVAFCFDPQRRGINDTVQLPRLPGQLVDSTCLFSGTQTWAFFSFKEAGRIKHRCHKLDRNGAMLGWAEAQADDGSWLGAIRGKRLIGESLFSVSDEGVVKVREVNGTLEKVAVFPDTEPFVNAGCHLLALTTGLHVVDAHEINCLTIASS
jgi:hypothetical protein